jgi:hypothetical protein
MQLAGMALQTAQWHAEAKDLRARIDSAQQDLQALEQPLAEPSAHQHFAALLERLRMLALSPSALSKLDFDGQQLRVTVSPKGRDLSELQTRARAAGGALSFSPEGAWELRFNPVPESGGKP